MNQKPISVLVITIIGIVTSGFSLLFSPCGLYLFFRPLTPNPLTDELAKDPIYVAITLGFYVVGFFLSLALLALSIAALKLVSWARVGMMLYAMIVIAWAFLSTAVSFAYVIPRMAHILAAKFPGNHVPLILGIVFGILGFFYALALPVAILICFRRTSVVNAFKGIFPEASTHFPVEQTGQIPPA